MLITAFFIVVNWIALKWCCSVFQTSDEDTSQFDTKFTRQTPVDSPDDSVLSDSINQVFQVGAASHCASISVGSTKQN